MKPIILLLFPLLSLSQPTFQWAGSFVSNSRGVAQAIKTHTNGDIVTAGYFRNFTDFDPGGGLYAINSGTVDNGYVCRYDPQMNFQWARHFASGFYSEATAVTIDRQGNTIVTGIFGGTVDLDPSAATQTHSAGTFDIFIVKLDPSGNFTWGRQIGGQDYERSMSICVDASGNIYLTGVFTGTVDFDPGAGQAFLNGRLGSSDMFVMKLDASGNYVWAGACIGNGTHSGNSIATDSKGAILVTGQFNGELDFDPGPSTNSVNAMTQTKGYVLKLASNGAFTWVKTFGTGTTLMQSLAVDRYDNISLTGQFFGTGDFDPGAPQYTLNSNSYDLFMLLLDSSGTFTWARQFEGNSAYCNGTHCVDRSGDIYLTGNFQGTIDFDPGPATSYATAGSKDIFLVKLLLNGTLSWIETFPSPLTQQGIAVSVDPGGGVVSTGHFDGQVDFDPGAATYTLTAPVAQNSYIHKMNSCISNPMAFVSHPATSPYCAPIQIVLASNTDTVNWSDANGFLNSGQSFTTQVLGPGSYTYFASTQGCNVAGTNGTVVLNVSPCTGINETSPGNISIAPNPFTSVASIRISGFKAPGEILIRDINGKIVLQLPVNSETVILERSTLACGVYLYEYADMVSRFTGKLVILEE